MTRHDANRPSASSAATDGTTRRVAAQDRHRPPTMVHGSPFDARRTPAPAGDGTCSSSSARHEHDARHHHMTPNARARPARRAHGIRARVDAAAVSPRATGSRNGVNTPLRSSSRMPGRQPRAAAGDDGDGGQRRQQGANSTTSAAGAAAAARKPGRSRTAASRRDHLAGCRVLQCQCAAHGDAAGGPTRAHIRSRRVDRHPAPHLADTAGPSRRHGARESGGEVVARADQRGQCRHCRHPREYGGHEANGAADQLRTVKSVRRPADKQPASAAPE